MAEQIRTNNKRIQDSASMWYKGQQTVYSTIVNSLKPKKIKEKKKKRST